jgi:hypothetical protein
MNSIATALDVRPPAVVPIRVRDYAPGDRVHWDAFVYRCPDATFFHRIGWKDVIEECFGHRTHYLVAERGDQIVGVLPLAEVKSFFFGHALVSLPFAPMRRGRGRPKPSRHCTRAARKLRQKEGASTT